MAPDVRSSLIAGAIAFVIYLIIALATGGSFGAALVGAVIVGAIGVVGTFLISRVIAASRSRR